MHQRRNLPALALWFFQQACLHAVLLLQLFSSLFHRATQNTTDFLNERVMLHSGAASNLSAGDLQLKLRFGVP